MGIGPSLRLTAPKNPKAEVEGWGSKAVYHS